MMKSRSVLLVIPYLCVLILAACGGGGGGGGGGSTPDPTPPPVDPDPVAPGLSTITTGSLCENGLADGFPCSNVDLRSRISLAADQSANDIWGWTDTASGAEYALMGLSDQTAFVDITDASNPIFVGFLPNNSGVSSSLARDIKTQGNFAFIVSEAPQFGLQVFDLTRLRDVVDMPFQFSADATYSEFGSAHNIAINEQSGFAYIVGSGQCGGGAHIVNLSDPLSPAFAGCDETDGYTHDAQCVIYQGDDTDHVADEICFNSNEDSLTVVEVTDKSAPMLLSRTQYENVGYTHQGWLTEDHAFFFLNDELDERSFSFNRRTLVFDVRDLENPFVAAVFMADSASVDHNLYVFGDHVYQANYREGLSILRFGNLSLGEIREVGHFDTQPGSDATDFEGLWSSYPFFSSGLVVASDRSGGLFVLAPNLAGVARCNDGLDNDADGLVDFPADDGCAALDDDSEI